MKHFVLLITFFCCVFYLSAQTYPEPEFSNEVYYLRKDSVNSLFRLEKGSSKMENKTKAGGFGGYEMGYVLDEEKSTVRLNKAPNLSFVFSTGATTTARKYSPQEDSMMRANGMDPSMMSGMGRGGGMDPANNITLYKAESEKGKRKILMQKAGGAFGGKKAQSSDKYTFSVKKIREGYWELVIDKPLPKGEYAFTATSYTSMSMDGSITLYTFGID
ncbi:MAG: hypothetical protein ACXWWC_13550 [Chitinophagaceae bacterium]